MKKLIAFLLALAMLLGVCSLGAAEETKISFEMEEYSVAVGKGINLKTIVTPKSNLKLEWSSSNEEVATVSEKGAIKALSVGETVITVKAIDNNAITASCKITVVIPVKKITFTDKSVSLAVNASWKLNAKIEPEDATNKNIVWSSSNEKVAIVSKSGVVYGVSKGSAKITAETQDGSKVKATIGVKVDEYDMVFMDGTPQTATYYYGSGRYTIKGKVKTGCVSIPELNEGMYAMIIGGLASGTIEVKPVKAGEDVITVIAGRTKTNIRVYVSPDVFKLQDLGFGEGAFVKPGELGVFNGHTYSIVKNNCTWSEADKKCKEAGGHLVTITSADEQRFIEMLNINNGALWIGLYKDNDWKWVTDEKLSYTNWNDGEPNDYASREFPYENAVGISTRWNDYHEDNKSDFYGYICEWDDVTIDIERKETEGNILVLNELGTLNDHTYQIFSEKCSWKAAKEKCESFRRSFSNNNGS